MSARRLVVGTLCRSTFALSNSAREREYSSVLKSANLNPRHEKLNRFFLLTYSLLSEIRYRLESANKTRTK